MAGANETGTILLILIIAVWFFTSARFQALKNVITSPFTEVKEPPPAPTIIVGPSTPTVISGGDGVDGGDSNANVG